MAQTETAEAPAAEESSGGRTKLVVIGAVVLVAVLAGVYFLVLAPGGDDAEMAEPETMMMSDEPGPISQIAEATVSLGGEEPHFAQITYSAVLSVDAVQEEVEAEYPRMRSRAQQVFRRYDAATLDTEEGFEQLQSDLTAVAQELWPDGAVIEVLIESLLVQ